MQPDWTLNGRRSWAPIVALGLYTITAYGTWAYGFGVLLEPLVSDTGWSRSAVGATYGLAMALSGLLAFPAGRLLDRFGPGVVFALHIVVGSGLMLAAYRAEGQTLFVVLHGLGGGVSGATGFYAMTTVMATRVRPDRPDRAIAVLTMIGAFSSPIYLPLVSRLAPAWPWRSVGQTLVVVGMVVAVAAALIVVPADRARSDDRRHSTPATNPLKALIGAGRSPTVRRSLLVYTLAGAASSTLWAYQVPMLAATGLALTTAGTVGGLRGLCQLVGRAGLAGTVERFGTGPLLRAAYLTAAAGAGLLMASGVGWFGRTPVAATVAAVGFAGAAGAGLGAASPLQAIHARNLFDPSDLGLLMGLQGAVVGIGGGAGPILGAALRDATDSWWPTLGLTVVALSIGAALLPRSTDPKPASG